MTLRDVLRRLDKLEAIARDGGQDVYCAGCDEVIEVDATPVVDALEALKLDIERFLFLTEGRI